MFSQTWAGNFLEAWTLCLLDVLKILGELWETPFQVLVQTLKHLAGTGCTCDNLERCFWSALCLRTSPRVPGWVHIRVRGDTGEGSCSEAQVLGSTVASWFTQESPDFCCDQGCKRPESAFSPHAQGRFYCWSEGHSEEQKWHQEKRNYHTQKKKVTDSPWYMTVDKHQYIFGRKPASGCVHVHFWPWPQEAARNVDGRMEKIMAGKRCP